MKVIGDTHLRDLPAGAVVDVEEHRALVLVRQGYARLLTQRELDQQQAEHR